MSCSSCGSGGCNRCGLTTCGCNSTRCGCGLISSVPFYSQADVCLEDHTQKVYQAQYKFGVCPVVGWNIPACGLTAVVSVPGIAGIAIGSYIWNVNYGYFQVQTYDSFQGLLTVVNTCIEGNVSAGTQVPACTCFTLTDAPQIDPGPEGQACLAVDFTAPAEGDCILITLTSLGTVQVGDEVQIGTGRYLVDEINTAFTITICNEGLGITSGTPVIAIDANGQYQYCLLTVGTCCTEILSGIDEESTSKSAVNTDSLTTDPVSIIINNTSTTKTMRVMMSYIGVATGTCGIGSVDHQDIKYDIQTSVNGSPYASLFAFPFIRVLDDTGVPPQYEAQQLTYTTVHDILPGGALTISGKFSAVNQDVSPPIAWATLDITFKMNTVFVAI